MLADDFAEHGAAVIAKVRQDDPRVTCGRSLHCAAVLNVRAPDIKAVQLQRSLMRAADEIYSPVETRQAD